MNYLHDLDEPLLKFSKFKADDWKIRNAVEGSFIVGSIGSGKSSGSGRTIAKSFLQAGFGGLVLCAKPEEADTWRRYCAETGRENSLIVMDGTGEKRFNFIDYELARVDAGSHTTPFALDALMKIYEAMQLIDGGSGGGGGNESFWRNSVRLLLSHSIDAVYLAYGQLKFDELMLFVRSIPTSQKAAKNAEGGGYHMETLNEARNFIERMKQSGRDTKDPSAIFSAVMGYFWGFYELDSKTRSNILATLEAMVLDFTKGDLVKIFCSDTNIVPEMSHYGAVIVLDFPLKKWQRGGILAQHLFKFAWQRCAERRDLAEPCRPIFLWADEYQLFVSNYDNEFSSTSRSRRIATVYLTQSIPALREAAKGAAAVETVDSLLNNFKTRIIHTCLDNTTRTWAADCIGKSLQWRYSESENLSKGSTWGETTGNNQGWSFGTTTGEGEGLQSHTQSEGLGTASSGGGRNRNTNTGNSKNQQGGNSSGESSGGSHGTSEGVSRQQVMDYSLEPSFFGAGLKQGGKENGFLVDGVFLVGGKTWQTSGKTWLTCSFPQMTLKEKWKF
jgi:hypothetical protein